MLEAQVERALKVLEGYGFEALKLKTPGYNGTKDRLLLWPKWSPAPPVFVEIKQPGKFERALQEAVRDDWRARGCDVRDMCDTLEKVHALCGTLVIEACHRYFKLDSQAMLPRHICVAYSEAVAKKGVTSWV